jgi:hypothetical protein
MVYSRFAKSKKSGDLPSPINIGTEKMKPNYGLGFRVLGFRFEVANP